MTLRHAAWFAVFVLLTVVVSVSAPAYPQDGSVASDAAAQAKVEEILKQQEDLLKGQRFSYEPGSRRDPFLSLYEIVRSKDGPRPKGVGGMYIDEVDLNGIIEDSSGGDLAYVTGSDNKGYFMRVGQSVYDGYLFAIDANKGTITFRQKIDDPRQIKPYRDVVRRLVPEEGSND